MGIKVNSGAKGVFKLGLDMGKPVPVKPFGMRNTPFDPAAGKYLPLSLETELIRPFTVVADEAGNVDEYGDYLHCTDEDGNEVDVAKPYNLRRSPFDGEEISGITYVYSQHSVRTASEDGEADVEQTVTPSYFAGEEILAVSRRTGVATETETETDTGKAILFEDINTAGRTWMSGGVSVGRFVVVSEAADTLTCNRVIDGETGTDEITVNKPAAVQGATGLYFADDEILAVEIEDEWEALTVPPYWVSDPA